MYTYVNNVNIPYPHAYWRDGNLFGINHSISQALVLAMQVLRTPLKTNMSPKKGLV